MTTTDFDQIQVRSAPVTDLDEETGIVTARLVPYEVEAQLDTDLWEVFTRKAFSAAIPNPSRCKITDQGHQRSVVIGHAVELVDGHDGVEGRLKISDTVAGRDVLTLIRDGSLTDLSVEFRPQKRHMRITRRSSGVLVRHDRAVLVGVSPVGEGAYGQAARVLSVRAAEVDRARESALARLGALTAGARR
jgi:uncharacterized protein